MWDKLQRSGMGSISVFRWRGYEEIRTPLDCKVRLESDSTYETKTVGFPSYPAHLETEIELFSESCGFFVLQTQRNRQSLKSIIKRCIILLLSNFKLALVSFEYKECNRIKYVGMVLTLL